MGDEVPSVAWLGQCSETEGTSTPVENVVITTKGLQERKTTIEWDGGEKGNE